MSDYIDRVEAQTAIQFVAKRYTVAHEAHGNGRVVWSDILIALTDAMNALRDVPSAQPEIIRCKDCEWWTQQKDSIQGRCALMQMYPTGEWFCGNAQERRTDG